MEGINAIVTGDLVSVSEQELVDCDSTNDGCNGGFMDYAFEWVIKYGGIDTESNYPYTGHSGACYSGEEEVKAAINDGYEDVAESESALLCASVNQPISAGIDASSLDFQLYASNEGDSLGVSASKPKLAKHKLAWTESEEAQKPYQPLQWKMNPLAAEEAQKPYQPLQWKMNPLAAAQR